MTTAFYVIKTYQSVFERRMRTLQFRSPGIAPGDADESAPGRLSTALRAFSGTVTRGRSVVFDAVDLPCPGPIHLPHTLLIISMTFVLSLTQMFVFLLSL